MSLLQSIINLLAGFTEKDVVVGGKKSYLFEYDYPLDDGTLVSVKTNGNEINDACFIPDDIFDQEFECNYRVGSMITEKRPPSTRIGMLGARGYPGPPIDNKGHNYGL